MSMFVGDICDMELMSKAFENVDVVFHCAAFINFQFPLNEAELERVNVDGTFALSFSFSQPSTSYATYHLVN